MNTVPSASAAHWVRALDLAELRARGRGVARSGSRQIALFLETHGGTERVYACNNRCPHEGYPLVEGHTSAQDGGCRLTCHYLNWAFDLASGDNVYGGDRLRVYPVELRESAVWVDISDPPPAERIAAVHAALRDAREQHDYARIARELARLERLGADPRDALRAAIVESHDRLEDGMTHAYAASAAWLRLRAAAGELVADTDGAAELRLICLQEAIGHIAWDTLREPPYPYPSSLAAYSAEEFVAAIEAQDEDAAIAQLHGALAAGLHLDDLDAPLAHAALAHYADFGHSLIYLQHVRTLVDALGAAVEAPLLRALVRSYVRATREDLLPEFREYAPALAAWPAATGTDDGPVKIDGSQSTKALLAQVVALAERCTPQALHAALLEAGALNLARFDTRYEQHAASKPGEDIGWLDFTHAITFAHAVRGQCARRPALWPQGLLQMALFVARNRSYVDAGLALTPVDEQRFERDALARVFDHGVGLYIYSAHLLKTWLAARDEIALGVPADVAATLRAAVWRYLVTPVKQKHTRRAARLALAFVARED